MGILKYDTQKLYLSIAWENIYKKYSTMGGKIWSDTFVCLFRLQIQFGLKIRLLQVICGGLPNERTPEGFNFL